jgi:UDP-N-acetylmuramoyl-tripeptide--D-alanyl-D-alanine ligase
MAKSGGFSTQHYKAGQVASFCGGTLVKNSSLVAEDVQIDSRNCSKGSVFFALKGEKNDGFSYIEQVASLGCSVVVVPLEKAKEANLRLNSYACAIIAVAEPLRALQLLAKNYLAQFTNVSYIGVTGSCGKTTTKEALSAITKTMGPTVKTPGNFNSEIGLPLSLLQVQQDTEYGVFEMGVDHVGEMDRMVDMVKPDYALLTNIGISHLEKFGTQEMIASEKAKIFHSSVREGFMNKSCRFSSLIEEKSQCNMNYFGYDEISYTDLGLDGWAIHSEGKTFFVKCVGKHLLMDVIGAIKVAKTLGATPSQIAEGLEGFVSMKGRSSIINGDVTIIEDYYNASLDSTNSILDYLETLQWKGYKKAVLGPMKELGAKSAQAHSLVARHLMKAHLDRTFLFGTEMKEAYDMLKRAGYGSGLFFTEDFSELENKVGKDTRFGDLYLVKASRSVAMERLIPTLRYGR